MNTGDTKFVLFAFGMGSAIASSLIMIYLLLISLMGNRSLVYEGNPIIAIGEIPMLILAVSMCAVSTEIYLKYEKLNGSEKKTKK